MTDAHLYRPSMSDPVRVYSTAAMPLQGLTGGAMVNGVGELASERYHHGTMAAKLRQVPSSDNLIEQAFNNRSELKIQVANLAMHLSAQQRRQLFQDVDRLIDPAEWETDQELAKNSSFGGYLRMLTYWDPQVAPSLGLSPGGNLLANWSDDQVSISLEFQSTGIIRYFVSRRIANEKDLTAGHSSSLSRVREYLAPFAFDRLVNGQTASS